MMKAGIVFSLLLVIAQSGCKSGGKAGDSSQPQAGVSPYAKAEARRAAFFEAVQRADAAQIENLTAQGFDVNTGNEVGVTPIIVAAGMNVEMVRLLVAKGARVNAKTSGGYTALMAAALNGQKEIVKLLLDNGADPTPKDTSNRTAIKYASEKNHNDIVDLLKRAGAKE